MDLFNHKKAENPRDQCVTHILVVSKWEDFKNPLLLISYHLFTLFFQFAKRRTDNKGLGEYLSFIYVIWFKSFMDKILTIIKVGLLQLYLKFSSKIWSTPSGCLVTDPLFHVWFLQATLCSMKGCMRALVAQLKSESEDLQQVLLRIWSVFLGYQLVNILI